MLLFGDPNIWHIWFTSIGVGAGFMALMYMCIF